MTRAKLPSLPLALPPSMPQLRHNAWRNVMRGTVRASGWRLEGAFPDVPKLVLIVAPHSSWWDGVWGLLFKVAMGVDIAFMAKRELFRGPLGTLLRGLGGVPIARGAAGPVVRQMVARFAASERLWLVIEPEGTRKAVEKWKSGFWHIAREAGVPVLPGYFDYPRKVIGLGPLFQPTADKDADIAALRAFYAPYRGKHRGV
ncbi:MAG TPA: 1-acyl-sn-glycerol-3-phosphate acyltransferase [Rhodanobacteraceae bacterium]